MVTEQVSQSEQVDFTDKQSESVPQQSAATSSVEPVEDDVIVLSSDESNDYIQARVVSQLQNLSKKFNDFQINCLNQLIRTLPCKFFVLINISNYVCTNITVTLF